MRPMIDDTTRRRVLQSTGAGVIALVAGCAGGGQEETTVTTTTPTETTTETPTETTTETTQALTPALSVMDQSIGGTTVTIPAVTLDGTGWVVVHPEAQGGGPAGAVMLARKRLEAGSYQDLSLEMDRVLVDGATVYAMLHYDDPKDGEFTFPAAGDPPVTTNGSPIVKPFRVSASGTVTPSLSVTDQMTDGSTLRVPSVLIDEPGWVVVHPAADGGGPTGSVTVAQRHLKPGRYADLRLELTKSLSSD
ncbi:MAG: hypothetical protein ABEJ58_00095 [Halodesulfurarchaeum sp.]